MAWARNPWILIAVGAGIVLCLPFCGAERLAWNDLWTPGHAGYRILWELRLPRLGMTLFVGGALAVLGAAYQILFHNPLAEPYLLGVSSAVTLGLSIGEMFLGFAPYSYSGVLLGLCAALAVTLLLVMLSLSPIGDALDRIVLFGTGLNFLFSASVFLLMSYHSQQMGGGSMRWIFGQIPWLSAKQVAVFFAAGLLPLLWIFLRGRALDALGLGDSVAATLGVSPVRERTALVFVSSVLVSLIVAFSGAIGFVGLIVPHAVRLTARPRSARALLAGAFVLGAVFLSIADVLSRAILPPFEFPIGILTTLLGTPFFLYLLWKR